MWSCLSRVFKLEHKISIYQRCMLCIVCPQECTLSHQPTRRSNAVGGLLSHRVIHLNTRDTSKRSSTKTNSDSHNSAVTN